MRHRPGRIWSAPYGIWGPKIALQATAKKHAAESQDAHVARLANGRIVGLSYPLPRLVLSALSGFVPTEIWTMSYIHRDMTRWRRETQCRRQFVVCV